MIVFFLACLAGVNLAASVLSYFIWYKNRQQTVYLYFSIFSFFSAIYIFLSAITDAVAYNLGDYKIISAAIYYGVFPWFIFKYIKVKKDKIALGISLIFGLALIFFFTSLQVFNFPLWQFLAHIGLVGLVYTSFFASNILKNKNESFYVYFLLLTLVFTLLAFEEIMTTYTHTVFLSHYVTGVLPLDFYPLIFSIVIGQKLALDIYIKSDLEYKLSKSRLRNKQLKITSLEKDVLEKRLALKNKDLTDFGIKLNKSSDELKTVFSKLSKYKSNNKIKSEELNNIIKDIKAQLRIDNRHEIFNKKIQQVNHEYIEEIKLRFPDLTENEINLACLLKLKLNTKEIATIKNITPDSVKVLRSRLRKKLKLETKTNVVSFLNEIG